MTARHVWLGQLAQLRLPAMARALEEQLGKPEIAALSFEERLGLMLDRESLDRSSRRFTQRLRQARLRFSQACVEDLDLRTGRGAHQGQILELASCRWIDQKLNLLITGKTGVGKSFLGCALAHQACREGYTVLYRRLPQLFRELAIGRSDGSHGLQLQRLARADLLVLDDWGCIPLATGNDAITTRSSRNATACARPWSSASSLPPSGTRPSANPPSPTPSSIDSSAAPTPSSSRASHAGPPPVLWPEYRHEEKDRPLRGHAKREEACGICRV